jgi:hypothetical protein
MKSTEIDLSSRQAWQTLRTVLVVDIDLSDGKHKHSVTQGSSPEAMILGTLGMRALDPAPPQKEHERAA